jgi:putative nucleotidyltransferase with HDIG domain
VGNAWFAIGAAACLVAAGGADMMARPAVAAGVVAAQFAADFAASAVHEGISSDASLRRLLGEGAWVYGVDLALTPAPICLVTMTGSPVGTVAVLLPVAALLGSFAAERRKRIDGMVELQSAYQGTALLLGDVVEADDGYTGEHCRNVVELAQAVGRELRLGPEALRNLEFGALLHDVGKIAIPKAIINKPGPLDDDEWALMRTHTIEGQRMLDRIGGFMGEVGRIVRSHHERWDGGGYPDGLAGEAIPLEARIITVCDAYNAMTTDRSYRSAMTPAAAAAELRAGSGMQFDPRVVDAVLALLGVGEPAPLAVPAVLSAPAPSVA